MSKKPYKAMQDFASQESKRAVDEFKEKLKNELEIYRETKEFKSENPADILDEVIDTINSLNLKQ